MQSVSLLSDIGHDRGSYIRSKVNKNHKIIEIGASYNPMFGREEGYNVFNADHDTQEQLVAKYLARQLPQKDVDRIAPVDFVATDGDLSRAIPPAHVGTFDFCFSSHNIEHIPNPIVHLQSIENLLKPDGRFIMVVPDKRGCFDLLRPLTTTGQWVRAYVRPEPFHSSHTLYDAESYSVLSSGKIVWPNDEVFDDIKTASGLSLKMVYRQVATSPEEYRDAHAWVFTPYSLLLIMREISALRLTSLYPMAVLSDGGGEFIVELAKQRGPDITNDERIALLSKACREQAEAHMRLPPL